MENRSGVNRRLSRSLEAGRSSVTLAMVERIADALQVEVATLFGERDGSGSIAGWLGLRKAERALVVALVGYFAARGGGVDECREGGS